MIDRTFHITTFGCQMNATDSDWLRRSLLALGFAESPADAAAVRILNTCSVRDKPEQKVYSEIGRIRSLTGDDPGVLVCVGGCVAQQVGEALFKRFRQVRLVFGADGIAGAPAAVARLMEEPRLRMSLLDFSEQYEERDLSLQNEIVSPAAFVSIMQGCDNFCAYCIVPYVRGRQKSRSTTAVLAECRALLERGAKEIMLLGQNVNAFGHDSGEGSFAELLYRTAALPNLARLRFITPHPKDLGPDVVQAFAELPVLAPRLHLPLQSGCDRILKLMGRRYDKARFMDIVRSLRRVRPEMHFSTDIIVGFPGETEAEFEETLAFMQEVGFAGSFSFAYSDRPGAKAAMLPGKLDKKTKLARLARLQEWQFEYTRSLLEAMRESTVTVMLESPAEDKDLAPGAECWQGREERGHPVIVRVTGEAPPGGRAGALVPVRVTGSSMHGLKGEQV